MSWKEIYKDITLLSLLNKASLVIKSSKIGIKRDLPKTLFSNFFLNGENLEYTMVSPLSVCQNVGEYKEMLPRLWMIP